MKISQMAAVALAAASPQAQAQDVIHWAAPAAATGQYSYFPMGTELQLTTRTELNTKHNHPGDRFYLEVAEPLLYRGQVVIPVGAMAVGEVTRSERNGHFGKKGELAVRLLYVQTPSGPVRLSGRMARSGKNQSLLSIGSAVVLLGWGPLLIHGTSGKLPAETPMAAYLADDLRFAVENVRQQTAATVLPNQVGETAKALPTRFDPSVFSANRP